MVYREKDRNPDIEYDPAFDIFTEGIIKWTERNKNWTFLKPFQKAGHILTWFDCSMKLLFVVNVSLPG